MKKSKMLLVVDDEKVNRKILSKILKADGFETIEAENGKEAFDIISDSKNNIALVLLDLTMPVMNGYELINIMDENGYLSAIPVIVTTGSNQDCAEVKSLECGASDFITKPYNGDVVCNRVRSILRLYENAVLLNSLEIDPLTGVYNREFFYRYAEVFMDEHPDEKFEIVCSNIENFKLINSKYGVSVGDELLKFIAEHNKKCIGENGVCGWLGADSFVALRKSRNMRTQEEVGRLYNETFHDAPVKNFTMQYGIYTINDRTQSISTMCDLAQLALTSIKHKFGIYYAVYENSMSDKMLREHQLCNYMVEALEQKQFVVYLQPKHDINSCEISGAEALVRWIHPELGFISPGEFIPLFEHNGFITKLDQFIWNEVCIVLNRWQKEGKELIPISVNASRADFSYENLPEMICEMVDSYDIPHEFLHFEVTESAYTENPQQIISAVSALRAMGFLIEMDDFGSGYSSLNMLSELPIDLLKLDMRFLQNGDSINTASKRSVLSFIVSLSKWLQFPTIAEGVETKDEVELLKTMGCNYIQGYYFAKPMPVTDFEKYMSDCIDKYKNSVTKEPLDNLHNEPSEQPDKPLILIVDDIESNRNLLSEILKPYYNIAVAENGAVAHQFIKAHADEISCITLDLLMPVMDGFQLLDIMREDGSLNRIPVIITSEAGADSELRAIRIGADSFVSKPYNSEILLHHVIKAIHEYEFRKLCDNSSKTL